MTTSSRIRFFNRVVLSRVLSGLEYQTARLHRTLVLVLGKHFSVLQAQ